MKQNHKKLYLLSALLLSTSLSTTAHAACPAGSAGTITVNGASTGCVLDVTNNTLIVTSSGNIDDVNTAGVWTSSTVTNITNSGDINGGLGGVLVNGGLLGTITNNSGATISSSYIGDGASAIYIDNGGHIATINNSGTIDGDIDGIRVTNGSSFGDIINQSGSILTGESTGIYVLDSTGGSITNNGYLNGGTWQGIHISNSTITSITNGTTGTIDPLTYGSGILLDDGSLVQGDIRNDGTIYGRNATSTPNAAITVNNSTVGGDIINNGIMEMSALAGYDNVSGIEIIGSGASVTGSIINDTDGTIAMRTHAISVKDGANIAGGIVNRGSISTLESYAAIRLEDAYVGGITNETDGTITSNDYYGLSVSYTQIDGNISNAGSITGTGSGRGIYMGYSTVDGDIINDGSIDGGEGGLNIYNSTVTGDITNNDHIGSADGDGLYLSSTDVGGVVTNNGYIGGSNYSIYTFGSSDVITINNFGELDGDAFISMSILNLEAGTIMADAIDGSAGVVNIKTSLSTAANYGASETLEAINIRSGNTFSALGSNSFRADNFTNEGTFSIRQGEQIAITGNYYQDPGAILRIQANSTSNYGQLSVTGDATFENSALFVDVTNGANFANNAVLSSVISATGTLDAANLSVSDNSSLFNFSTETIGDIINLIVAANSSSSVVESVNNENNNPGRGAAIVLDQIINGSPTGDMAVIRDALGTLGTQEEVSKAVSQTLPTLTGGATSAMMQTMSTTSQVVQARQDQNLGLSSGDDFIVNQSSWFKAFGSWANQGTKDGVVGFGADTYGMVAGADRVLDDSWRLGAAFTYANTNVDSDDKLNKLDVDTYLATIYSSYTVDPQTEANLQLSLGYNNNESSRSIIFGGLNRVAEADFDSYSFNIGAGIGRRYDIDASTSFVPSVRFDYNLMTNESYRETGAGGLNLNVKSQTTDQFIPAVQAKFNHDVGNGMNVSVNAGAGYDLLNDVNTATSSYVGGGTSFVTKGLRSSPWIIRTGLGATYKPSDAYDITVRYDREDRGSEFDNQSLTAKLRMPF